MFGRRNKTTPLTYLIIEREDGRIEMYHQTVLRRSILTDMNYTVLARCETRRAGLEKLREIIDERYSSDT